VRIDVRPILSTLPGGWRQGWIVLRGNGWERPLPWSGEDPAPGLELVGAVSEAPGRKVTDELRVGPGLHEVEVLTASVDCLVAVASGVPELQFGMFPTLTQGRCKALGLDGAAVTPLPDADALSPAAVAEQLTFEQRYDDVVALLRAGQVDAPARTLALLAFVAEQDPCLKDAAILAAEMLEQQSPAAPGTLALRRRLLQGTSLRPTTSIAESAGELDVRLTGWQPASPGLEVRKAILGPMREGERMLTGTAAMTLRVGTDRGADLQLEMRQRRLEYVIGERAAVAYQVDGGPEAALDLGSEAAPGALSTEEPHAALSLHLSPGAHSVRIRLQAPSPDQFVAVRLHDARLSEAYEWDEREESDLAQQSRKYFVGTRQKPVRLNVEGPRLLWVEERRGESTTLRPLEVPPGWQEIRLGSETAGEGRFYRVLERVAVEEAPTAGDVLPPRASVFRDEPLPPRSALEVEDFTPFALPESLLYLGGQEDGTLNLTVLARKRRLFEEDGPGLLDGEKFLEVDVGHRKHFEGLDLYTRTLLLGRVRTEGGPVLGAEEEVHARPEWLPFWLSVLGTGYLQWPEGDGLSTPGFLAGSLSIRASASRRVWITERVHHTPSVFAFGRYLSLDEDHGLDEEIDQDVFTNYKHDHRSGWGLSDRLVLLPWLDTEWWGAVSITSNEDWRPGNPDHFSARAGWSQYFEGVEAEAAYQYTRFFNDSDRNSTSERHSILGSFSRRFLFSRRQQLDLGVEARYDFPDREASAMVFLSWYFSEGRGYRDFWPAEVGFRRLRLDEAREGDARGEFPEESSQR